MGINCRHFSIMATLELGFLHNRKHQSKKIKRVVKNCLFKTLRAREGFNFLRKLSFIAS